MTTLIVKGCFDVLHEDHKEYIDKLLYLSCADRAILFLGTNRVLRELKGEDRPLFDYSWREKDMIEFLSTKCLTDFSVKPIDSIEDINEYVNHPEYVIGVKDKDELVKADNIIRLSEINRHHTSDIVKTLKKAEGTSDCTLIKVGAVLVRQGAIATSDANGTIHKPPTSGECPKHNDITIKCIYLHAEEVVLSEAQPGDDLFVSYSPCINCAKQIVEKQIRRVVYFQEYIYLEGVEYLKANGVKVRKAGLD